MLTKDANQIAAEHARRAQYGEAAEDNAAAYDAAQRQRLFESRSGKVTVFEGDDVVQDFVHVLLVGPPSAGVLTMEYYDEDITFYSIRPGEVVLFERYKNSDEG